VCKIDVMSEQERSIKAARACAGAELVGREDLSDINVMGDTLHNSFFHEFAKTVKERDGAIVMNTGL